MIPQVRREYSEYLSTEPAREEAGLGLSHTGLTMETALKTYTGGFVETNAYAFEAPDGWVLFDAPEGVGAWMEGQGLKVGLLVLTHLHFDHITDAARVRREHGCRILSMSAPDPDLTLEKLFGGFGMLGGLESFLPDEQIDPAAGEIDLLGASFRLFHVPGHSPDSLCFLHSDSRLLFGGDVLFAGGIGRTDFPGGDHELLISGIRRKLFPLGDDIRVLPGHGPATTLGEERRTNPFAAER